MSSKEKSKSPDILPEGCTAEDEDLLIWIRSIKCPCTLPKDKYISFCIECYGALSEELRYELWRPWTDGFAKIYSDCIQYLEDQTNRFTCPKNTSSSRISTLKTGLKGKQRSGKSSPKQKKLKSVSAQETSPKQDFQNLSSSLTSQVSAANSKELSTSQATTSITEVILRKSYEGLMLLKDIFLPE